MHIFSFSLNRWLDRKILWLRRKHRVHRENCCILCVWALFNWLWGLPPKHAYRSQQTEKTVAHAFVSTHVHHSYHSLSFYPPPPHLWIDFYYHSRCQNKQTSIHQLVLSASALCEPFCLLENISALTVWQERASILKLCSLRMPPVQKITVIVKPGKASTDMAHVVPEAKWELCSHDGWISGCQS